MLNIDWFKSHTFVVAFVLGLERVSIYLNTEPAQPFKINQFVRTWKHRH